MHIERERKMTYSWYLPMNWKRSASILVESPGTVKMKLRRRGAVSANPLTNHLSKLVGLSSNFFFVFSFDHHPSQILGTGIAQQQSPVAAQLKFELISRRSYLGNCLEGWLASNTHIHQNLRITRHSRCKVAESASGVAHRAQQLNCRNNTVACKRDVRNDDVSRLLASKLCAARQQLLKNVSVAHLCPRQFYSPLPKRKL